MGQQQLLLIILGVIVVGLAIAVGISIFGASATESNKDGVTSSLINIGADAHAFKLRPKIMGGGRPSFKDYEIPTKLKTDEHGQYEVVESKDNEITLKGISTRNNSWTATCRVDENGYTILNYTGWN